LGKHVEICRDTPLFLGNRMGIPAVMIAAQHAMEQGITAAESDALLGKPFGMGDGFFGMVDVVGLGLIPDLASNAAKLLPSGDDFHKLNHRKVVGVVEALIAQGHKGRADGGGFFRPKRDEAGKSVKDKKGKTILQSIDLNTGEYVDPPAEKSKAVQAGKQGPRAVLEAGGKDSDYAWSVVRDIILYALNRVPEIADHIEGIDAAMRTGYNWEQGPFELLDKIGVGYFTDRVKKDGIALPPLLEMAQGRSFYTCNKAGEKLRLDFDFENKKADYVPVRKEEGVLRLDDVKRKGKPVIAHKSASTWDLGDGVLGVEFHSKMNAIDPSILYVMNESLKILNAEGSPYEGMVIFNEGKDFSVGANIGLIDGLVQKVKATEKKFDKIVSAAEKFSPAVAQGLKEKFNVLAGKMWGATFKFVDNFAYAGQPVFKAMRESPKPVVAAPHGKAWGGGCEVFLHCASVVATPETYPALVESGAGLNPGWGGIIRLLERMLARPEHTDLGPFVPLRKVFEMIADPYKSGGTSAQDAFYKGWLRYGIDEIVANPERQLADAKAKVLELRAGGYTPPEPVKLRLPGAQAKTAFKSAIDSFYIAGAPTTWYDVVVTDALGDTLSGGDNAHIGKIVTEEEFLKRERENFASLTRLRPTLDRIHHLIVKGAPLREGPLDTSITIDKIRAMRKVVPLPDRPMTGKPLDGEEGERLKRL
ncbi:MAG TPA: 3-hydroxyacyl-CoA dehydrogenase family protein, partial [Alphaproteobacteria bacterium]